MAAHSTRVAGQPIEAKSVCSCLALTQRRGSRANAPPSTSPCALGGKRGLAWRKPMRCVTPHLSGDSCARPRQSAPRDGTLWRLPPAQRRAPPVRLQRACCCARASPLARLVPPDSTPRNTPATAPERWLRTPRPWRAVHGTVAGKCLIDYWSVVSTAPSPYLPPRRRAGGAAPGSLIMGQ